jgi:diguanylate cyclase (GGDEF)-like protein/PAS domain S-box-containing protein
MGELGRGRPASLWSAAMGWLPRGAGLGYSEWQARHRGICVLLWLHALGLPFIALLRGQSLLHGLAEAGVVAWFAVGAQVRWLSVSARSALATLGLVTSSAVLVHFFDGLIEVHFHFFVMVAVVALYQAWMPFLLALVFVVLHHSLTGTFAPDAVYSHAAAVGNPWLWGLVHGGFVLAESVACLIYWRASEETLERERDARVEAQDAHRDLVRAQELSRVGSWDWDVVADTVTWSDQMYTLVGVNRDEFTPSVESFLDAVHPDDRGRVADLIQTAHDAQTDLDYECRLDRPDGTVVTIHALGETVTESGVVTQMRGTCHDVTERNQLQDEITHLAFHDPLTGLANRRLFLDRLDHALAQLRRSNGTCAILFIDLDDFKEINDSYGHTAGDALLVEVAVRLRQAVRETDTIARFGGDEFAVLCDGADIDIATQASERIEAELSQAALIESGSVAVVASIGIAIADRDSDADALLRQADAAMYAVKSLDKQIHSAFPSRP